MKRCQLCMARNVHHMNLSKRWKWEFKCSHTSLQDDWREGHPSIATEPSVMGKVEQLVLEDRHITVDYLVREGVILKQRKDAFFSMDSPLLPGDSVNQVTWHPLHALMFQAAQPLLVRGCKLHYSLFWGSFRAFFSSLLHRAVRWNCEHHFLPAALEVFWAQTAAIFSQAGVLRAQREKVMPQWEPVSQESQSHIGVQEMVERTLEMKLRVWQFCATVPLDQEKEGSLSFLLPHRLLALYFIWVGGYPSKVP